MIYTPLKVKSAQSPSYTNSMMPKKGINKQDLAQMMGTDYALKMVNYIPYRYGLEKRKGLDVVFERAGANPITLLKEYTDGVWIFGYSTYIEVYDTATDAFTTIKSDFGAGSIFDGTRYGDYFFTCNGIEKIGRISLTLAYDGQTGNFTVGQKITGGTSGATAVVLQDSDSGATGTLTLGNIEGTFQNNELITDAVTGSATVNGTLTYTYATVTNGPICGGIKAIGPRLYAYRIKGDESAVQYSEVDAGITGNPPFTAWSDTTAANDGGFSRYRNAGPARSVCQLGQYTVVFSDKGFYAFFINTIDSAGTLKKVEVIQNYTEDFGGARGAIETPIGIFHLNEAGLWHLVAVGTTNTPMSKQQLLTSDNLGGEYFKNVDQTDVDLVHDVNQNCILVTCAKNSTTNNLVVGFKLDLKAFFEFKNWNINRFAKSGGDIYGASSVKSSVYKLFEGYDDDGLDIGTECYVEIPLKTLFHAHALLGLYAGGFLSPSSELTIRFDIYTKDGVMQPDKEKYLWTAENSSLDYDEWGSAAWGESAWGGGADLAGLVESFGGGSPRVNNLQRLRMKITGGDKLRHILNWIAVRTQRKGEIKRRNITRLTS